mgnify:FL=1
MPLRRFRIKTAQYEDVIKWLRTQKVDPEADEKSPEPLADKGFKMPVNYLPKIVWGHKVHMRIKKGAHGKDLIEVEEQNVWKRVVPEDHIDGYLREALLSSSADVPMSRDAGYHIVQKRTIGISRRAFASFMSKQAVLQITKDAPAHNKKKVGRPLEGRGNAEIDLVEAKGKDIGKLLHRPTKNFYWITFIDRLTGWLEVHRVLHKHFKAVVPAIRRMVGKMQRAIRQPVSYIRSDSGSEFQSDTKEMLKSLGVRHRFVKSAGRLEQANKTFQKIWYRLLRLGRGSTLDELDQQAVAIFNNTLSSVTGRTPLEALDTDDAILVERYNKYRKKRREPKYKAVELKKGDRCRYIIDTVRGTHAPKQYNLDYKSYRGKHWSDVHTVVKIHDDRYYVARAWRTRDKLLKVPGVDAITRDKVRARHTSKKKGFAEGFEW